MLKPISNSEKKFIIQGCNADVRTDGRSNRDFRNIYVENYVLVHVNGSSRVKIGDAIDIMCSVKVETAEPTTAEPAQGLLEVYVDISPSCNLKLDDRRSANVASQISQFIQSVLIDSHAIDMEKLGIIKGKSCWCVYIDLMVLQMDGDVRDACSIAVYAALKSTKIPKIELLIGESGDIEDFDLCGDLGDALPLACYKIPIVITVLKIGDRLVVDGNSSEWTSASAGMVFAVDEDGTCCGSTKLLGGTMSMADFAEAMTMSCNAGMDQLRSIDSFFSSSHIFSRDSAYPDVPPMRFGLLA